MQDAAVVWIAPPQFSAQKWCNLLGQYRADGGHPWRNGFHLAQWHHKCRRLGNWRDVRANTGISVPIRLQ